MFSNSSPEVRETLYNAGAELRGRSGSAPGSYFSRDPEVNGSTPIGVDMGEIVISHISTGCLGCDSHLLFNLGTFVAAIAGWRCAQTCHTAAQVGSLG
jgi:hypothetical protein